LLLVAFHYPPTQGSSGVHRALAFSRYLPEFGWDVSVLTVNARAHQQTLAANLRMIPATARVIRAQAWDAARHFSVFGRYPSMFARPDRWASWIPFATLAGLREIRRARCAAIFTTYPIASAHVIGRNLRRQTGVPWIADFRDPMATATYPYEPATRKVWTDLQAEIAHEAHRITVTTPGTAAYYRTLYPDLETDRVQVIENGFDPEAFPDPKVPTQQVPVLLHSGILYPRERDPVPFFRALKRLLDSRHIDPRTLRVRFRASGFDDEFRPRLREFGLEELVELAPPLPYTEALQEMLTAEGLLLFQAKVCDEQIPAKAYEYLYAGRPIIGLANPEGDTGRLLRRFGIPGIAALEEEDSIVKMLETALPQIRKGQYPTPARQAVMELSRRSGAGKLAELLDELTDERINQT
jgi:glycosyltransferase involved in cell wall biosynthesis